VTEAVSYGLMHHSSFHRQPSLDWCKTASTFSNLSLGRYWHH